MEFKRDLRSPDNIVKSIVAFANSGSGIMNIGVDDDHTICGVPDSLGAEERLANILSDSIEPKVRPGIAITQVGAATVLIVEVYPSPLIPHHVRRSGVERGTFVRVGSTNRSAEAPLRRELGRLGRVAVRRDDRYAVPVVAVREAVVNAVAHADYSQLGGLISVAVCPDRVEIESPGLLPPGVSIESLFAGLSHPRNRVIVRVLHELGYMEQWGTGIRRMIAVCAEAGLPTPRFEEVGFRFRVSIGAVPVEGPTLDTLETQIVELLRSGGSATTSQLAAQVNKASKTVRTRLSHLESLGLVVSDGTGPNDPTRRHRLVR